jgi:hypothetical protein
MGVARQYLQQHRSPLAAYNALQVALLARYVARGGRADAWCRRRAARFRGRFGWMLESSRAA